MGLGSWISEQISGMLYSGIQSAATKSNEALNGIKIDNILYSNDKNLKLFLGRHYLKKLVLTFNSLKSSYPQDVNLQNYIKKIVPELKNIIKYIDNLKENTTTNKEIKRRFWVIKKSVNLVKDIEKVTSNFKTELLRYPEYLHHKEYKVELTDKLSKEVFGKLDNWVSDWKYTYTRLKQQNETLDKQYEAKNKKEEELRKKNSNIIEKSLKNAKILTGNYVVSSGVNNNSEAKNMTIDNFMKLKQVEIPTFIKGVGMLVDKSLENLKMAIPDTATIPINYKLLAVKQPGEAHKELEPEI